MNETIQSLSRILMVDDNLVNLDLQGRLLANEQWNISSATGAQEALDLLQHMQPDLILLDVLMPEMDGFELCQRIKEQPDLAEIPIIFVTADSSDAARGFAAGAVDYVVKPVSGEDLIGRIRLHLEMRALVRNLRQQVLDRERLAELGELVVGISHEVNSPLGVCVTALSVLHNAVKNVTQLVKSDQLSRNNLIDFLDQVNEATELAQRNLKEANKQMGGFKDLAVDQASTRKRRIDLKGYVHKLVYSLKPHLKKTHIQINIDIPDNLYLYIEAGALAQILRNLIMNSLIHGYSADAKGTIVIRSGVTDEHWWLDYADDGRGIPSKMHSHVFEKFVTSTADIGGSGLGLYIVKRCAMRLSGSIELDPNISPGTGFRLRFAVPAMPA